MTAEVHACEDVGNETNLYSRLEGGRTGFQFISSQWGSVERTRHGRKNRHLFLEEGKSLPHVFWLQEIPGIAAAALRSCWPQPRVSLIDTSGTQLEAGLGCFGIVWHLWLINCTSYPSYFINLPEIWLPICDQNIVIVFSWVNSREAEVVCTAAPKSGLCNLLLNSQALFLHTHSFPVFFYRIYLYMCVGHIQACATGYRWRTTNYHVNWGDQTQVTKLGSKPH